MSTQEIIAELWKLKPEELQLVKAKVEALAAASSPPRRGDSGKDHPSHKKESLAEFLLAISGTAEGLPPDMAENHDHYLYGTPKRTRS